MFKNLFASSSKDTLTNLHLKKCSTFINYLASKGNINSVIAEGKKISLDELTVPFQSFHAEKKADAYTNVMSCFINTIGQSTLSDYDTALLNSKYFFILDTKHNKIASHLTKLGANFFEGRLEKDTEYPSVLMDFRYTTDKDTVSANFEKSNTWFEFGKRPGHFRQVKCWKKQEQLDLKNTGGHHVDFPGIHVYPIKFLNKHYSLRSKEQARKKLVEHRLPRTQKEKSERGWHTHIDQLIEQQAKGWDKKDLIEWKENSFQQHYLLERISGVGIID